MLRIEALEKENRALNQKLNVTGAQDRTRDAAAATAKAPRERAVYNAMAADYPTKSERYAPPEVRGPQWAGPYLGLHAGMGFGKWPTSISNVGTTSGQAPVTFAAASTSADALGGLAGLHAGYLWQIGAFVFGPELDLDVSTVGSKSNIPTSFFQNTGGDLFSATFPNANSATLKWLSTFRGRAGIAAGDWLFFGTGGLAVAGLDLETSLGPFANSQVITGYAAGGGLEYAFGPNARLRVEYLYYGFPEKNAGSQISNSNTCNTCIPPTTTSSTTTAFMSVKPSANVIRAGIDWRFN